MFANLYIYIFALGVLFLPYTRAMTIDVGAPIKIYEALFALSMLSYLLAGIPINREALRKYAFPLGMFFISAIVSYGLFLFYDTRYSVTFRGGAEVDGLLRLAYLLMNIFILLIGYRSASARPKLIARFWLIGMTTSAIYLLYCAVSLTLTGDAFMLPGIERHQPGNFGPIVFSRSGTFEEGNFGGLYFLLSAVIAYRNGSIMLVAVALLAMVMTKSTSAYFGAVVLVGASIIFKRRYRKLAIPALMSAVVMLYGIVVYFAGEGKFDEEGSSSAVRINEVMTSFEMFKDHVLFGVGLGRYGFLYYLYHWNPAVDAFTSSERHIPNNIYAELLAETGLVGTALFMTFWFTWVRRARSVIVVEPVFYATALALMVVWLAYPTFNIAFMWAFLGIGAAMMRETVRPGALMHPASEVRNQQRRHSAVDAS